MKKRLLLLPFLAALLFVLSVINVSADEIIAYTDYAYATSGNGFLISESGTNSDYYCPDLTDSWFVTGRMSDSYIRETLGIRFYCLSNSMTEDVTDRVEGSSFCFDLESENIHASEYGVMRLGVAIRGGQAYGKVYQAEVVIETDTVVNTYYVQIRAVSSASELAFVNVDISGITSRISSVRINILYDNISIPSLIRTTAPVFSKEDRDIFVSAANYFSGNLVAANCSFDPSNGVVSLEKTEVGLSGKYSDSNTLVNDKVYFIVRMSGAENGTVALTVNYISGASDTDTKTVTVRLPIFEDSIEYVFPVSMSGYIVSYSLDFYSITASGGAFVLSELSVSRGSGSEKSEISGSLTAVKKKDNTIRFSGTVDRDYVKDYPNGKIVFCAYSEYGSEGYIILGSTELSTQFTYTADISSVPISTDTYKFTAAVETENGTLLPITVSRYYDADKQTITNSQKLGFSDCSVAGAFEANASHIIIDIPLDELILDSQKGSYQIQYTVYGEENNPQRKTYLNKSLINSIENEISFCLSAGMKVYIRFMSSTPVAGLTYIGENAENYALCLKDNINRHMFCAIVDFLTERCSDISGFVLGYDVLSFEMTGFYSDADPAGYASDIADVSRLIYNSASNNIDDIQIIIPFSPGNGTLIETSSVLLSSAFDTIGAIPWTFMYVSDSLDVNTESVDLIQRMTSVLGLEGFTDYMYIIEPQEGLLKASYGISDNQEITFTDYVASKMKECCNLLTKASVVFFYLADSELKNNIELYSSIKQSFDEEGIIAELNAKIDSGEHGVAGEYTLFDFSDKHYLLGWSGAGLEYLGSDYGVFSADKYGRVLKAESVSGDNDEAGIMIANFDSTVDLSRAPYLSFELAIGGENPEAEISLVFVCGTDEFRSEFDAVATADGCFHTYVCDLSDYLLRDTIDFIGIMIYSDNEYVLELNNVNVSSDFLSNSEIKALFEKPVIVNDTDDANRKIMVVIIISIAAVVSAIVFFILIKHDREENEADLLNNSSKNGGSNGKT